MIVFMRVKLEYLEFVNQSEWGRVQLSTCVWFCANNLRIGLWISWDGYFSCYLCVFLV